MQARYQQKRNFAWHSTQHLSTQEDQVDSQYPSNQPDRDPWHKL